MLEDKMLDIIWGILHKYLFLFCFRRNVRTLPRSRNVVLDQSAPDSDPFAAVPATFPITR